MTNERLLQIFQKTDFPHTSGTAQETQVGEYLKACCEELGVPAHLEGFRVAMAEMEGGSVTVDGKDIPCTPRPLP